MPEPMTRETLMDFIETVCEKWYEAGTSEQVWGELKAQLPAKIDALMAAQYSEGYEAGKNAERVAAYMKEAKL